MDFSLFKEFIAQGIFLLCLSLSCNLSLFGAALRVIIFIEFFSPRSIGLQVLRNGDLNLFGHKIVSNILMCSLEKSYFLLVLCPLHAQQ